MHDTGGQESRTLRKEDLPDPYRPDIESFAIDEDYVEAAFELLKEVTLTVLALVSCMAAGQFARNEAIRRALIKRLAFMGKSMLADARYAHGYQHPSLFRQIIDAAASYAYLAQDEDGSRHEAYVIHSLAEEKSALNIIVQQIEERGNVTWPIENRMRISIERMASCAGTELSSVPGKKKSGWPRAGDRLLAFNPHGYLPFRTGSAAIHSSWAALLQGDLREVEAGFMLDVTVYPDARPMTASGLFIADAAVDYLRREGSDAEKGWFLARLVKAIEKIQELDEAHERFIQSDP